MDARSSSITGVLSGTAEAVLNRKDRSAALILLARRRIHTTKTLVKTGFVELRRTPCINYGVFYCMGFTEEVYFDP